MISPQRPRSPTTAATTLLLVMLLAFTTTTTTATNITSSSSLDTSPPVLLLPRTTTHPCGKFNMSEWSTGTTLERAVFQSGVCISNKLISIVTLLNLALSAITFATVAVALVRDALFVSAQWSDSKTGLVLCLCAAASAAVISLSEVSGSIVVNSVGWICCTWFVCAMEHVTVSTWAKITIHLASASGLRRDFGLHHRTLNHRMNVLTLLLFVVVVPIHTVRAALYNLDDPFIYNACLLVYAAIMIPWCAAFGLTVFVFGMSFAEILEDTAAKLEPVRTVTHGGSGGYPSSTRSPSKSLPSTSVWADPPPTPAHAGGSSYHAYVDPRRDEFRAIARKARWVAWGIVVDKVGFVLSFASLAGWGGATVRDVGGNPGVMSGISFYGLYFVVIPWGIGEFVVLFRDEREMLKGYFFPRGLS
ncbi:hypothetical protein HDU96_005912 [Phlyctochytrium bullatum]|nr:hypothetical protein HDU96_005912 [Phlyctochytrium bullatum]